MKSSHLYFVSFFCVVNCEWVKITHTVNKKPPATEVKQSATTVNYDGFAKNPLLIKELFTTPTYDSPTSNEENIPLTNSVNTTNDFTHDMESNTASTPREDFDASDDLQEREDIVERNNHLTFEGFLPFLKMIQNNLFRYKNKSRKSKMSILTHLKDNLLINIKYRISNLWKSPKASFEARGYKEDDTHMDFPSNEGALMTIGFLTFAVFLIKLVIKLVQALKQKQQNNGMATTTTAASVVFLKRKKRDEMDQEAARILQYIDEF